MEQTTHIMLASIGYVSYVSALSICPKHITLSGILSEGHHTYDSGQMAIRGENEYSEVITLCIGMTVMLLAEYSSNS
jgi:hypothetical protein